MQCIAGASSLEHGQQNSACFVQAKRRKAEELKELARSIRDKNARLVSAGTIA